MAEEETIFSSKISYNGIFSFKDFYKFCYEWLNDEEGLGITEDKYSEKLSGDSKEISVAWSGEKEMTDFFKLQVKVSIDVKNLTKAEINKDGAKISMNKGSVQVGIKGTLVRDYNGKFETTAFKKFLRGIYERWVVPSAIEHNEDKIISICDEFLSQAKAYLDLEGKK
jgi:hypothetical protein